MPHCCQMIRKWRGSHSSLPSKFWSKCIAWTLTRLLHLIEMESVSTRIIVRYFMPVFRSMWRACYKKVRAQILWPVKSSEIHLLFSNLIHISLFSFLFFTFIFLGCRLFTLDSVNLCRKYTSIFDLLLSMTVSKFWFILNWSDFRCVQRAMYAHQSQMVWFRRLYIHFSRYMVINTLREMQLSDAELEMQLQTAQRGWTFTKSRETNTYQSGRRRGGLETFFGFCCQIDEIFKWYRVFRDVEVKWTKRTNGELFSFFLAVRSMGDTRLVCGGKQAKLFNASRRITDNSCNYFNRIRWRDSHSSLPVYNLSTIFDIFNRFWPTCVLFLFAN